LQDKIHTRHFLTHIIILLYLLYWKVTITYCSKTLRFCPCVVDWRYQLCWSEVGDSSAADSSVNAVHRRLRFHSRLVCAHRSWSVVLLLWHQCDAVHVFEISRWMWCIRFSSV